jgi:hypothetical protein
MENGGGFAFHINAAGSLCPLTPDTASPYNRVEGNFTESSELVEARLPEMNNFEVGK